MSKRILSIRVSGKERKNKVRTLLLDLAHFRNILLILLRKYHEHYNETLLNQSILYGLVAKNYNGKYKIEFEKILKNIENNTDLKELLDKLKSQKEKSRKCSFYSIHHSSGYKRFFKLLQIYL